jgi:hypothetical protein
MELASCKGTEKLQCLRVWDPQITNFRGRAPTSGVPQEDLQVDCPRVSLENPKSAIFSCDPPCSSRLSSCRAGHMQRRHGLIHGCEEQATDVLHCPPLCIAHSFRRKLGRRWPHVRRVMPLSCGHCCAPAAATASRYWKCNHGVVARCTGLMESRGQHNSTPWLHFQYHELLEDGAGCGLRQRLAL